MGSNAMKKCLLGYEIGMSFQCLDLHGCNRCGWHPKEAALRRQRIRAGDLEELENGLRGLVIRREQEG